MKIKYLVASLLLVPFSIYGGDNHGVKIKPFKDMDFPEDLKKEMIDISNDIERKGFYENENKYAKFLLNLRNNSKKELRNFKYNPNPHDTHLKSNPDQIKLSFNYKPLNFITEKDVIGYAASNSYIKNKGWNGIIEFFDYKDIGTCSYSYVLNTTTELSEESVKYYVNGKPTATSIDGSKKTGFIYAVEWFTDTEWKNLRCANMVFDRQYMQKTIELASKIDK
jgi:hypothetical protein